ncbi:Beta-lactamase [Aspergillus sp. HF37]|nr:Beta-lactamase [Aspergillus sp. HF37]
MRFSLHSLAYIASLATTSAAQFPSAPSLIPIPSYTGCPPNGPLLPRPTNLAQSKHFQAAADHLTSVLDSAVDGDIKAGWVVENVSFSLAVVSPNGEEDQNRSTRKPIWEYHHRAEQNTQGTSEVSGNSQYLVGSISKVYSDLVLLKSGVDARDPVTKFFPELASNESSIQWDDITLEALAEHLAGIPPNQILEILRTKEPVAPVNSRPAYSQLSFLVFALCLEKATGKSYAQLLNETIIQPLNLDNTGVSPGISEKAVIPPGSSSWGTDFGYNAPGGGLYSSTNDLSRLMHATLDRTILDTPAEVHKWLKPTSMTSSPTTLVGKPWEILRNTNLVPKYPHNIDIYSKSGGSAGYASQMSLVDQYGVGFALLTAGPAGSLDILHRAVVGTFMPAVEEEARDQSKKYTGNWTTPMTTSATTAAPISLSLAMDNGTGLHLASLTRNNASMLEGLRAIFKAEFLSFSAAILDSDLRIYPTGIETPVPSAEAQAMLSKSESPEANCDSSANLIRQDWHINMDIVPVDTAKMSDLPGQESLANYCMSWQATDWVYYGGKPMEKIVFVVDENTKAVVGVEVPGLRSGLLVRA